MPDYTADADDSVATLTQLLKAFDQTSMEMSERLKKDMRDIMDKRTEERASLVQRISAAARQRSTVLTQGPDVLRRLTIDSSDGRVLDLQVPDNNSVLALLEQVLKVRQVLPSDGIQITLMPIVPNTPVGTLGGAAQARTRSIDLNELDTIGPQAPIEEQYKEAPRAMAEPMPGRDPRRR